MGEFVVAVRALLRNPALLRLCGSWELFVLGEYAAWIAMMVYAYDRGGASTAGLVAVLQLIPGVLLAPVFAAVADRRSPVGVLAVSYLLQAAGAVVTAVVVATDGPPALAYAGATVLSTAMTATRPAQAALTPGLARSPDQLAAIGAVIGWLENVGIMAASALTGVALTLGGPATVFVAVTAVTVLAAVLLLGLRADADDDVDSEPFADAETGGDDEPPAWRELVAGFSEVRRNPAARLLVGLGTAVYVVVGALDVLFVVLAVDVLDRGTAWTGYLNTAYGVGGVLALGAAGLFLGRRLRIPLLAAGLLVGVALAAVALPVGALGTVLLLAAAGFGRAVADTVLAILLQRTVPSHLLARVFGVTEATSALGLSLGSLLVPLGVALGGPTVAVLLTAALVPLVLVVCGRWISGLDAAARVPVTETALLRAQPHLRLLPAAELEGAAAAMERRVYADGEVVVRQGDPGTEFFVVADGRVAVDVDGVARGTYERPTGLGEIALLRRVPRSATVVADGPAVLYALPGEVFLDVVTAHAGTARRVGDIATTRLAGDPGGPGGPGGPTPA